MYRLLALILIIFLNSCAIKQAVVTDNRSPLTDVYLIPVGDFSYEFTNQLANKLSSELHILVRASLPMGAANLKLIDGSSQVVADEITMLAHQVGARIESKNKNLFVVALTTLDINDPLQSLRFLFAKNDTANHASVISIARMFNSTSKVNGSQAQVAIRIQKMVKRAIGEQYFRLPRSVDITDVMYAPIMSLEDIDEMGSDYRAMAN
ncbi:hypothetical protein ACMYR3_11110 [Ampullimonas aquatilis]|uniref:hypothetical protein n=1 Tax=Ampullimonas aquatilis TaxID=1341549 RepID=UPI003C769C13